MAVTQYDREHLSQSAIDKLDTYTKMWENAATDAERANANALANAVRAGEGGYSGGSDGATIRAPNGGEKADAISLTNWNANAAGGTTQRRTLPKGDQLAQEWAGLYNGRNSAYAQALAAQQAANEAAVQKAVNSLEAQKTDTNNSYSDLFRQLYLNKMKSQKNIGQQMAASGVTGGAAETTLLNLDTAYSDALRQGEQGRIGAISALDRAIGDARLTGDITNAQAAAESAKERTNAYSSLLRSLIDRYDTFAARQGAYDREDAASAQNWARQLALAMIQKNGAMPDNATLAAAGMTRAQAAALLPQAATGRYAPRTGPESAAANPYAANETDSGYLSVMENIQRLKTAGADSTALNNVIEAAVKKGAINSSQAIVLRRTFIGAR